MTPRRPRAALSILSAAPLMVLAACGGTTHIGDVTPVVVDRVSGDWVLDARESDDPTETLAGGGEARPGARGRAGQPPAGGRGGMTGRGGAAGGRPMPARGAPPGGRVDPEAAQAMRRLVATVPTRLGVTLSDSLVTVERAGEEPWALPFGKKVERTLGEGLELEARAEWEQGRLVLIRTLRGGGGITETLMPSADGTRLIVNVEVSGGPRGFEFQRVYNRRTSS